MAAICDDARLRLPPPIVRRQFGQLIVQISIVAVRHFNNCKEKEELVGMNALSFNDKRTSTNVL